MASCLETVLNMSLTAGAVILVVLLARALLRRAPRWCSYALWSVVLFRLLCPVSISSALSMLNLARAPVSTGSGPVTMVNYAGVIQQSAQTAQQAPNLPVAAGAGAVQNAPAGPGWQEVLAWVWVCAAAAMLLWALVSYLSLRVRLWDSQHFEGRVYVSKRIGTAFVSGLIRPKIYLPENLSGRERECVLAHERCHIRRGDHLIKPLAYIALCLHWFNPLVWLAWLLAMRDMEASCDEAAIKRLGGASRADYAQTLLNLAAGRGVSLAVSLSFGDDTKRRIRAIARIRPARRWITVLAAVLAVGVIAGCAANPAPSETGPDNTPGAADAQSDGRYASVYDMLSTGYERSLGSVTWSSDGVSVFPATDWRIENLEKVCEIDGLDPDAVIEGWTYDVWFQLDIAEEDVNIAGGMQRDGDWFNLNGTRLEIVRRYPDGRYAPFGWRTDINDRMALYDSYYKLVWDEYMYTVGGMPVYILDWTSRLNGGDDTLGNFPAERFDGDGWYIYLPMQLWQYDGMPMSSHLCWVFSSAYGTGSTVTVEQLNGPSPYETVTACEYDSGDGEHEYAVYVPVTEDVHYVITARWDDSAITLNEYTATEGAAAREIADSFHLSASAAELLQSAQTGRYASIDEYISSRVQEDTESRSSGSDPSGDSYYELSCLGEVSGLAPAGTLEAWSYSVYYHIDAEPDEVISAGALQYSEGNYYCFEPDRRVYLLSYDDGSCSILSDTYSSDYGYGTASQQLYDWYVTENGLDLPLFFTDWTEQLSSGTDSGNFPAQLYTGQGWYCYIPLSAWTQTDAAGSYCRWESGYVPGAYFSVERINGDSSAAAGPADGFALHTYIFEGEGCSWRVTACWPDGTDAPDYAASVGSTLALMFESFTVDNRLAPATGATETYWGDGWLMYVPVEGWTLAGGDGSWRWESPSGASLTVLPVSPEEAGGAGRDVLGHDGGSVTRTRCVTDGTETWQLQAVWADEADSAALNGMIDSFMLT